MSHEIIGTAQHSILAHLPPFSPIKITSGVDRYGFSSVLAKRCGRQTVPRSFANWIHGWIWAEEPNAELLACSGLPRNTTIVVRQKAEQLALKTAGFKDVRLGGLPFAYIARQHTHCQTDALLAFPPHSAEVERLTADQGGYLDYLETLKQDFESIYISIYYLDMGGPLHQAALARGLKVVQGARPDDANSLLRTRSMLDSFGHVTSNVMGSHMLYALFADCKFSFCGPMYSYDESTLMIGGYHSADHIQLLLKLCSESYIQEKFGKFFVTHPRMGLKDEIFAQDSIGQKLIMNTQQIENAMGWSMNGQMSGYLSGGQRRLSRLIRSRLTGGK